MKKYLLLLLAFVSVTISAAQTLYITGASSVYVRKAPTKKSSAITAVKKGTSVELVSPNGRGGYFLIEVQHYGQGWVYKKYLTAQAPKVVEAKQEETLIDKTRDEIKTFFSHEKMGEHAQQSDNSAAASAKAEVGDTAKKPLSQAQPITDNSAAQEAGVGASSDTLAVTVGTGNKNPMALQALYAQNKLLQKEVAQLQHSYVRAQRDVRPLWFIIGAGVVIISLLIGMIVSNIRWRRKLAWGRPL